MEIKKGETEPGAYPQERVGPKWFFGLIYYSGTKNAFLDQNIGKHSKDNNRVYKKLSDSTICYPAVSGQQKT